MRRWAGLHSVSCLIAVAISAFGVLTALAAERARVETLSIIEAGFYTARKTGENRAPGTVLGHVVELADIKFLDDPPAKTASLGTSFGVHFRIAGEQRDATATLRSVWKIPEPGIHNPNNNNTYRQSTAEFEVRIGGDTTRGYSFDEPWEIVRGVWILEIWQDDRKLLERNFMIE